MAELSSRLRAVVDALPLAGERRVLEIGCGTGAAARAVAARLTTGQVVAIDRSAKAIAIAERTSGAEVASGRLRFVTAAIEDLGPVDAGGPFDVVFAVRVGALDGRHPDAGTRAMHRIAAVLAPGGRVFVDGGDPLRELVPAVMAGRGGQSATPATATTRVGRTRTSSSPGTPLRRP